MLVIPSNTPMELTQGARFVLTIPPNGDVLKLPWKLDTEIRWFSKRYRKWVVVPRGRRSDGATGAPDIKSIGWIVHDEICIDGHFADGTPCNNWQASRCITDILKEEAWAMNLGIKRALRAGRAYIWFWPTWAFGGGKCRDNGLFNF